MAVCLKTLARRPRSAFYDVGNRAPADSIFQSNGSVAALPISVCVPDCQNKARHDSRFGAFRVVPALDYHVIGVVHRGSQPKMVWRNTSRIISTRTVMANAQPARNWTPMDNPARAVSANGATPALLDLTITAAPDIACPQPASVRAGYFVNIPQKPAQERRGSNSLRREVSRISIGLHSTLCRALGCWFTARAFSF